VPNHKGEAFISRQMQTADVLRRLLLFVEFAIVVGVEIPKTTVKLGILGAEGDIGCDFEWLSASPGVFSVIERVLHGELHGEPFV
jgi:hypothetical protein